MHCNGLVRFRPLVEEAMSWPGRSHLAAAVAHVPEGERVTICGWVDRYRSIQLNASSNPPLSSLTCAIVSHCVVTTRTRRHFYTHT